MRETSDVWENSSGPKPFRAAVDLTPGQYREVELARKRFRCRTMSAFLRLALEHMTHHRVTAKTPGQRRKRWLDLMEQESEDALAVDSEDG